MEPKILNRDSFVILGTLTRVTPEKENSENYAAIWQSFESYHEQIKPNSTDRAFYGVSLATGEEGVFDYLAGMAVRDDVSTPRGLMTRKVPAARYAVFNCPVQAIGETYRHIFAEWLPQSSYEFDGSAAAFEQYPPENDKESPVLIHIPIKEKGTTPR